MEGMSMARLLLSDEDWELIADVFPEPAATGRPRRDARTVLDGILWVLRTGSPWRDVPEEFGAWKTCWRMFDQWNADGTLAEILHRLQAAFVAAGAIDEQLWCIDGTTVRAARCAAGGGKKVTPKSLATTR
jgi:transposase